MKNFFKEFGKYILGAAAMAILFASGTVPFSVQNMLSMAIDPIGTIAQATQTVHDTSKADIVDAVQEEKPELLKQTITEIKPNEPAQ